MAAGPNALRGSGPNRKHAFKDATTQTGSPDPRNDRICITSSCPRQLMLPNDRRLSCRHQQLRLRIAFATHHDGPGHPCDLVGKRNCGHLGWPAPNEAGEPREAKCFGCSKIDSEFILVRRLNWKIARRFTLENAINIFA